MLLLVSAGRPTRCDGLMQLLEGGCMDGFTGGCRMDENVIDQAGCVVRTYNVKVLVHEPPFLRRSIPITIPRRGSTEVPWPLYA